MKKSATKRISVLAVTIVAALVAVLAMPLTARATGGDAAHDPDAESGYEYLYYFSDSVSSNLCLDYLQNNIVGHAPTVKYIEYFDLNSELINYWYSTSGGYADIENAYVIYELTGMFPKQIVFEDKTFVVTAFLEYIFKAMSDNGCKIMFICNTDEYYFANYDNNKFLDYVDVHINTDIFSYFVNTIFNNVNAETRATDTTIILDESLSLFLLNDQGEYTGELTIIDPTRYNEYGYWTYSGDEPWLYSPYAFVNAWLIPYLRYCHGTYRDTIESNSEFLDFINVNVICYYYGMFYDVRTESYVNIDEYMQDDFYFIGTTRNGIQIYDLLDYLQPEESHAFIYIENNPFINNYNFDQIAGLDRYDRWQFLEPIITDFLYGSDCSNYDNWQGRCRVTVKPVSQSSWLLDLFIQDYGNGTVNLFTSLTDDFTAEKFWNLNVYNGED